MTAISNAVIVLHTLDLHYLDSLLLTCTYLPSIPVVYAVTLQWRAITCNIVNTPELRPPMVEVVLTHNIALML